MAKDVQLKGSGVVVDQAEVERNLGLLDETVLRLMPLMQSADILKRVQGLLSPDDVSDGKELSK